MLLVIIATQLVVALVTGLVISTAYKNSTTASSPAARRTTGSRSSRWPTAKRSTSW